MEYHVKVLHTLGQIQNIARMIILGIFYTAFRLATQTVAPNFHGL